MDMKNKRFKQNEITDSLLLQVYTKGRHIEGMDAIEQEVYGGKIYPSWVILRTLFIAIFECTGL